MEERAQQEDVLAEKRAELPETARPQIEEKAGQAEELQESASVEAVVETQAASVASELKAAIEAETVEQVADTAAATGTAAATEAVAYTSALSFEFGSTAEPIVSTAAITPVLMDAAANNEELGQLSISTDRATAIDRSVIEQSIAGRVDTLEEAIAAKTFLEVPTGITDRTEILDLVRFEQTKGDILGTIEDRTDIQSNFIEDLHSQSVAGIGAFVDADMEAASAKLQALQVQQQLGIQSLSIANEAPENIMALFG
ncbi:flagellin [Roseibium sp. RKSG952]|uniref:flagellin n=1 Tax=Roseibium sp. RKSG952 TaxID=2529384 RepID=UPI0027391E35|nr:flagellin [Roseibium sp. RKSG952]